MYRCWIEPTVRAYVCVLPLFRIYQTTTRRRSSLEWQQQPVSRIVHYSVALFTPAHWFCCDFACCFHILMRIPIRQACLSLSVGRKHTQADIRTYRQLCIGKLRFFLCVRHNKNKVSINACVCVFLFVCVCAWVDNQQTSLTHFSIYKIDAHAVTLLCSVIVARPRNFACPFRQTHAPHHRPTLLAFNPPTVRNQFTTRQAARQAQVQFFVLQSNLIGVKEEAKVLRTHTRTNT